MSEQILIKKKKEEKKKEFDYSKAVSILKPLVKKWTELDEEVAKKLHEYYLIPECKFVRLCELLEVHHSTIYSLFDRYELPRKHEAIQEAALNKDISSDYSQELELEPAQVEDEQETEYDTIKYQEIYTILNNFERISLNMFKVVEKPELIKKLQKAIKHGTTILLKLESNIED